MLKRNAIVKFVLITIIAILGILLCVCPFSVPYSSNNYNGFIKAINKGVDLEGGVTAVYNCSLPSGVGGDLSEAIDNSLSKIDGIFKNERFSQLYVDRQGGNKVYIMASADASEMNKAFYYIENGKPISFTSAQVSDTLTEPEIYLDSNDIKSAKADYDYNSSAYGITIEFTNNGYKKLENLKKIAGNTTDKKVYVYLGEFNKSNLLAEISTSDINSKDNTIFITASSNGEYKTTSADEVREIAYSITGGMLDIEMKLIEVSRISPVLGKNTQLYIGICLLAIIALAFILLCVRYGELGLVGSLSLVFYLVLFAFFMQAIPFITLTMSGVIGSIVAFILACLAEIFIFEKIKEEYAMGKKIHLSCKGAFKRALWPILDLNAIIILASIFIWVIAPSSMKCFAIALIIGAILSVFNSLAVLRGLVKNYLAINSTKAKRMRLYRDKNVREFKEDIRVEQEAIIEQNNENLPNLEEVSND